MEQVQMNTRIGVGIKHTGDEVLRRYGYTPSSAVQALWTYLAEHNALPPFMPSKAKASDLEARKQEVADNAGFAIRLAVEAGVISSDTSWVDELDYDELRELSWEERGAFRD
mgnify:CR=1 FL=1